MSIFNDKLIKETYIMLHQSLVFFFSSLPICHWKSRSGIATISFTIVFLIVSHFPRHYSKITSMDYKEPQDLRVKEMQRIPNNPKSVLDATLSTRNFAITTTIVCHGLVTFPNHAGGPGLKVMLDFLDSLFMWNKCSNKKVGISHLFKWKEVRLETERNSFERKNNYKWLRERKERKIIVIFKRYW